MNSLILSSLATFGRRFMNLWRGSGVYALLMKIYGGISASWNKSAIMTRARREGSGKSLQNSKTAKVMSSPFALMALIREKASGFFERNISGSFICSWSKTYIHSFMALNTRFFGVMLVSCAFAYCAAGGHISKIALIAGIIGAVMCVFNYDIMSFMNPSKVVDIVKSIAGFKEINFDFFDKKRAHDKIRLLLALLVGLVTGAAMSVSIIYGVVVPFALFFMLLVMYAPVTGVFIAVFAAPFAPTMALAGICIWTLLSLLIKSVSKADFRWRFDGVGLCVLLFLAVLFISSALSFAPKASLKVWAMYLVFVSFYFVIINTVKTREELYGLLKLLAISGALVALYGIAQYVFGWTTTNSWIDEEMFEDSTMRVYSTLGNPNVLGEYLLLVLPVAAVFMLKFKWKSLAKYAYAAMFLVCAVCLILTQSRGCWIGFVAACVIFVTFYEGKLWGLLPLVLLIIPFIIPETMVDRFMSIGNMEDSSTSYRVFIWLGTLGMMKYYWLGGIGMGEAAFAKVYPFFSYNAIIAPHSHNTFLQLLVEAGIAGLGTFVVMQGVFLKQMSVVYRADDKKSTDSVTALALASGVAAFLVQSMFDYTFYNYRVMAVFFMVLALGMALRHIKVPYEREVRS